MTTGAWIAVAAVALALGFGTYRLLTDGRFRGTRPLNLAPSGDSLGGRVGSADPLGGRVASASERIETTSLGNDGSLDDRVASDAPLGGRVASASERIETSPLVTALRSAVPDAELGERATLLQFSSAFCAPCRATRRTLTEVAELVPGVTHVEVDAEHHLELVRTLGILRTPTTLVLDAAGREVTRASGAPRKEQVLAALGHA